MTAPLRILDTGLAAARWNVAMTAALVEGHADGTVPDTVRFHRYCPCVLLGNSQAPSDGADLDYCRRNGIEIARRLTGGGSVFMDPGMLAWDVVLGPRAFGSDIGGLTRRICEAIAGGLSRLGVPARFRPPNDIETDGRKIWGSSGYVCGRSAVLQGTVLIECDVSAMAAALNIPDRALRSNVSCLASELGAAPAIGIVQDSIAVQLGASFARTLRNDLPGDHELLAAEQRLLAEIGSDDYVTGGFSRATTEFAT